MNRFISIIATLFLVLFCPFLQVKTNAYTDLSQYASFAGKIDITAIGRTLKASETTLRTSSSCSLALPAGTTVKAAYLYWAGSYNSQNATSSPDYNITLRRTGSTALNLTADRTFTEDFARFNGGTTSDENYFGGFKDVTSYVLAGGAGTYTVSNLTAWTGAPHSTYNTVIAGWAIFIVYEYPDASTQPIRVINIYDGFKLYYSATTSNYIDINPSNFVIPQTNINGKNGYLTWEGDTGNSSAYENLFFNGNSLTSTANPANNVFNSTLTLPSGDPNSSLSSTAGNDANYLGMDLDFFNITSYLKAGDTSATARFQTGTDMVLLNVEVVSVTNTDVADVTMTASTSGAFVAGTTGAYTVSVRNNGPNSAGQVTVKDVLPAGLTYVSTQGTSWTPSVSQSNGVTTVSWTYAGSLPIPKNTSLPNLVFNVAVDSSAVGADGKIANTISVTGSTFDNHKENDSVTLHTDAVAMKVVLTSSARGLAKPGDSISYVATLTNIGSVTQTSINVTDFSNHTAPTTPSTLAFGASLNINYPFTVPASTPLRSVITNTITVSSTEMPLSAGASSSVSEYIPSVISSKSTLFTYEENLFKRNLDGTGINETIYIGGDGFAPGTSYTTAFYDAGGNRVASVTQTGNSSGFFLSSYDNSSNTAAYGTWTSVVMPSSITPAATLSAQMTALPTGITDTYTVASSGMVDFTDKNGTAVDGYDMTTGSTTVYLKVTDSAANTSSTTVNTVSVNVVDNKSGDTENITLTETGVNTGVFTNQSSGLTVSTTTGTGTNNGTLRVATENSIRADYVDTKSVLHSDEVYIPLLALLTSFKSIEENGKVVVEWETSSEVGTIGFYLKRKDPVTGEYKILHNSLLPGLLVSPQGGIYRFVDSTAVPGKTYIYKLTEIEIKGKRREYGPFTVTTGSGSVVSARKVSARSSGVNTKGSSARYMRVARKENKSVVQSRIKSMTGEHKVIGLLARLFKGPRYGDMKITVTDEGLYYLSASEIAQYTGYSESRVSSLIGKNMFSLTNKGFKVAYMPSENNQGIYFYGENPASNYTDRNIYLLKQGRGIVMRETRTNQNNLAPSYTDLTFKETSHFEQNLYPLTNFYTDPYEDFWVGDYVVAGDPSLGTINAKIPAPGLAKSGDFGEMIIKVKGGSSTSAPMEHHGVVYLNSTKLGDIKFDGTETAMFKFTVAPSLIQATNTVTITGILDSGVPYSIFYLDYINLTYSRTYTAQDGMLAASGHGTDVIRIAGFSGPGVRVLDITDKQKPIHISDSKIENNNGTYAVTFRSQGFDRKYLAIDLSQSESPFGFEPMVKNDLKLKSNDADYLVITPESLAGTANSLAVYRSGKGYKTKLILVEQIMDEFNDGNSHPEAIKDFLDYAFHNWRKKPRYVVLIGSGSYDYKNIQGYGECLMPPIMTGTPDGLFPSDNMFADISGDDGLPDLAIGRLPAHNDAELKTMIDKIISYEKSGGSWTGKIIMAVDNPDPGGNFPELDKKVEALVPFGYTKRVFTLDGGSNTTQIKSQVIDALNNGALLFNYLGHGGVDQLAEEDLLDSTDISLMTNSRNLSVMSLMTCTTGLFAIPGYDSISEKLLTNSKGVGAVSVWAPSGLSMASRACLMDQEYFKALFNNRKGAIGDIVLTAIREYARKSKDVSLPGVFVLFGDPALKLAN